MASLCVSAVPARYRSRKRGCGTRDSHKYWLNLDPCGLICAGLSWSIVLYCAGVVASLTLGPWYAGAPWAGRAHCAAFWTLAALALASHARAMLSNPGATPLNSHPVSSAGWARTCLKCDNHKPARAHHCSICGRCIMKMGAAARRARARASARTLARGLCALTPPPTPFRRAPAPVPRARRAQTTTARG
jgi:hypothetical protein